MSLSVVFALATITALGGLRWGRAVLVDEERYLRAVNRLPGSRRLAHIAGWSVSLVAQHHSGWHQGLSPRAARLLAVATRRTMPTRSFGRAWMVSHRWLHRRRGPDLRVAATMLLLAATGEMVGLASRVRLRRVSF